MFQVYYMVENHVVFLFFVYVGFVNNTFLNNTDIAYYIFIHYKSKKD